MGNTVAKYLYESVGLKYLSTGEEEQEVKLILALKEQRGPERGPLLL